jgi:hypothetical protein
VFLALTLFLARAAPPPNVNEALQALSARMDKAANEFKAMTAQVTSVTHSDVLNEDSTETGTVSCRKYSPVKFRA